MLKPVQHDGVSTTGFDTDRPAEQRPLAGVALRLLTALLLALMFALVKLASTRGVHVVESLFYRQIGSALCAIGLVAAGPGCVVSEPCPTRDRLPPGCPPRR